MFPDCVILYCAEMHNGNMPQEVSSSFTTANPFLGKIGTFFSYAPLSVCILCTAFVCMTTVSECAVPLPLESVFLVALWILGRIHPSIFYKSSLHLFVLYSVYTNLAYHYWDCWFIQVFHSCENLFIVKNFPNDAVVAEDHVCFYLFTRILLSTVGILLSYQMSQLR